MHIELGGKTALVTGSTGGIGKAIATGLAAAGARVAINGRGAERVAAAIEAIGARCPGAELIAAPGDIGTADGVAAVVAALPAVDILVNNAGIFAPQGFFDIPDSEWTRFFEVNVLSGVRLARAYMPGMLAANWGRIVFISSESALHIPAEMIHYGVSKTAQLAVSRGLAELTAGTGVTVNSVLPGPTRSDGVEDFLTAMAGGGGGGIDDIAAGFVKQLRPTSLLQRFATVEEVANMVVYACSKQASATNGAALRVEGGIVRTIA
ncbi:SDR family NAD(P)-dependent oxidoreductase [Zavarzinia compransoris]|uniref:Oxidoreductase n=1 Tax=Zavarzinia compransoris TaxID=1264899 RepID=A0A317DX31_9PROT|nr:SDR family oxidoreductase [Zavarzinia compransoris]PWR19012.1 oxidoreductase [Zavarzinia compransoris]TDP49015.1 short-subunit dehydrogenase [Zavarzinia compransoris]